MGSASARGSFFTADDEEEEEEADHMEAGFSGKVSISQGQSLGLYHRHSPYSSRPSMGSLRNIPYMASPANSPGSGRFFYDPRCEETHHRATYFLDSCALCQKPLGNHRDIFMYKGDTAFCSEECRQEQMEMDEASEKNRGLSSLRKDQRNKSTTSPSKSDGRHLRTGTVAAG